jgi:hypothetical protein
MFHPSDFELGCGALVFCWVGFGTFGIMSWRQDRRINSKLGRIASRVFNIVAIGFLLTFFTAFLGSATLGLSDEQPPAVTSLKPPDGWWRCSNK